MSNIVVSKICTEHKDDSVWNKLKEEYKDKGIRFEVKLFESENFKRMAKFYNVKKSPFVIVETTLGQKVKYIIKDYKFDTIKTQIDTLFK